MSAPVQQRRLKGVILDRGDTVRCLNASGSRNILVEGRVYPIRDIAANGNILLYAAQADGLWWTADRFELVTKPQQIKPQQIKPGDVVESIQTCVHDRQIIEVGYRDVVVALDDRGLLLRHSILPRGIFFVTSAFKVHKPAEIKAGDTVRCMSNAGLHHTTANHWLEVGKEYKVASADDHVHLIDTANNFGFAHWRFDVVNPFVEVPDIDKPKEHIVTGRIWPTKGEPPKVYKHKAMPAAALRSWSSGPLTDHMAAVVALNELVGPRRA